MRQLSVLYCQCIYLFFLLCCILSFILSIYWCKVLLAGCLQNRRKHINYAKLQLITLFIITQYYIIISNYYYIITNYHKNVITNSMKCQQVIKVFWYLKEKGWVFDALRQHPIKNWCHSVVKISACAQERFHFWDHCQWTHFFSAPRNVEACGRKKCSLQPLSVLHYSLRLECTCLCTAHVRHQNSISIRFRSGYRLEQDFCFLTFQPSGQMVSHLTLK